MATPDAPVAPIPSSTTEPWGYASSPTTATRFQGRRAGSASAAVASASRAKQEREVISAFSSDIASRGAGGRSRAIWSREAASAASLARLRQHLLDLAARDHDGAGGVGEHVYAGQHAYAIEHHRHVCLKRRHTVPSPRGRPVGVHRTTTERDDGSASARQRVQQPFRRHPISLFPAGQGDQRPWDPGAALVRAWGTRHPAATRATPLLGRP